MSNTQIVANLIVKTVREAMALKSVQIYRFEVDYLRDHVPFIITGCALLVAQRYYESIGWTVYREGHEHIWFIQKGIDVADIKSTKEKHIAIDLWINQ
jgi:hypothetical protein